MRRDAHQINSFGGQAVSDEDPAALASALMGVGFGWGIELMDNGST